MKFGVRALPLFLCVLSGIQVSGQTKRALLIGINNYQPEGTNAQHSDGCVEGRCALSKFENLRGAVNDAQSMSDLLTSPKFGFPVNQIVLLTNPAPPLPPTGVTVLPAAETSHDGILAAMQKYLVDDPKSGDTVVFYDASHGSLRINSQGNKLTVLVNGKYVHADSTLVPSDAYKGGYDIRDREMARIFNAALDKGIHLTVIFDSCHSGGISRGIRAKYRERVLPFDPRDINQAPDVLPDGRPRAAPTERDENPALVFSAAQQDQTAKEMPLSDAVTEPHGAFTAALVETLQTLPAQTPASVIYQRVRAILEGSSVTDQEPDLDATAKRRQQPLFGGVASDTEKVRAAAIMTDDDGDVWLDIGLASGIGKDSEFTSITKAGSDLSTTLRITGLKGIARSTAKVVSPAGAKIVAGEIFELTKWVPAESAPLLFWTWPTNLSEADIDSAVAQLKIAGIDSVTDPAEQSWTDILCWNGTNWTVQHAGTPTPFDLGTKLSSNALMQHLSANARLWVNLPPSRELAEKLVLHDSNSAVQAASDLPGANYVLAGVLTETGPAYAWFHKDELNAGPPTSTTDHSPGCSATSQYPVRSDWAIISSSHDMDAPTKELNKDATLLAKAHGWLELASSPASASIANYYNLAIVKASDQTPLPTDQPAVQDELVMMALASQERVIEKRWVYVLDIDCHGRGSLIYPVDNSSNQFPNAANNGRQIVLSASNPVRVSAPFGVDTLILLSSDEPLPDPSVLNFEGVAGQGARGMEPPLLKLLGDTSGGRRSGIARGQISTDWGIDVITLRTVPTGPPK